MKHIVVDLEMNKVGKEHRNLGCTMETIEIGAIMLDENFQEISSFRTYVKPEYNTRITSIVRDLTGITYDMVINAPKFNDNDYKQVSKELRLKKYDISTIESKIFSNEWNDFQEEFDTELGFDKQVSLSLALDMAGIDFLGREHSALDDARNTAKLFHVFKDREMFDITLSKIAEAMKPTEFGTSLGSLFDFSGFAVA